MKILIENKMQHISYQSQSSLIIAKRDFQKLSSIWQVCVRRQTEEVRGVDVAMERISSKLTPCQTSKKKKRRSKKNFCLF